MLIRLLKQQCPSTHVNINLGANETIEAVNIVSKHTCKHEAHPPQVEKEFHLDSNDFELICAGVSNVGGYKRNT